MTPELATVLAEYTNVPAKFWMAAQKEFDEKVDEFLALSAFNADAANGKAHKSRSEVEAEALLGRYAHLDSSHNNEG